MTDFNLLAEEYKRLCIVEQTAKLNGYEKEFEVDFKGKSTRIGLFSSRSSEGLEQDIENMKGILEEIENTDSVEMLKSTILRRERDAQNNIKDIKSYLEWEDDSLFLEVIKRNSHWAHPKFDNKNITEEETHKIATDLRKWYSDRLAYYENFLQMSEEEKVNDILSSKKEYGIPYAMSSLRSWSLAEVLNLQNKQYMRDVAYSYDVQKLCAQLTEEDFKELLESVKDDSYIKQINNAEKGQKLLALGTVLQVPGVMAMFVGLAELAAKHGNEGMGVPAFLMGVATSIGIIPAIFKHVEDKLDNKKLSSLNEFINNRIPENIKNIENAELEDEMEM